MHHSGARACSHIVSNIAQVGTHSHLPSSSGSPMSSASGNASMTSLRSSTCNKRLPRRSRTLPLPSAQRPRPGTPAADPRRPTQPSRTPSSAPHAALTSVCRTLVQRGGAGKVRPHVHARADPAAQRRDPAAQRRSVCLANFDRIRDLILCRRGTGVRGLHADAAVCGVDQRARIHRRPERGTLCRRIADSAAQNFEPFGYSSSYGFSKSSASTLTTRHRSPS
jgi:hypothetical protein